MVCCCVSCEKFHCSDFNVDSKYGKEKKVVVKARTRTKGKGKTRGKTKGKAKGKTKAT